MLDFSQKLIHHYVLRYYDIDVWDVKEGLQMGPWWPGLRPSISFRSLEYGLTQDPF